MGQLRRRVFTPSFKETTLEKRGFGPTTPERQQLLETVGRQFLTGYGYAMLGSTTGETAAMLETIDRQFRGFAYEGAAMGMAMRDAITPWPTDHFQRFLAGPGAPHVYMTIIGAGWAMARVPEFRWRTIMPTDPLLRWLALDGYGFHQAYFRTEKYVRQQYVRPTYPAWPGSQAYVNRGIDQGIGRALWFVNGADPVRAAASINSFAPHRRADLWNGAGLASTYAGGVDIAGLETFAAAAGEYLPEVAQAAAFAAKTRLLTDLVMPHTETAVKVYCGCSVEEAAAVTDQEREGLPPDGAVPAYEVWRERIKKRFS
jgi:hypothetical protein